MKYKQGAGWFPLINDSPVYVQADVRTYTLSHHMTALARNNCPRHQRTIVAGKASHARYISFPVVLHL